MVSTKQLDRMYEMGQISMFEWFDLKDRYSLPENQTDRYMRTCLFPTFGRRSYHLGKIELAYALNAVKNNLKWTIDKIRRTIELREDIARGEAHVQRMIDNFMARK